MRPLFISLLAAGLAFAMAGSRPGWAQQPATDAADPSPIDPAAIPLPDLDFEPTAQDTGNFDKYFYFHRADTDFATAYADLRECDGYARGLTFRTPYADASYPYANTIGGALGSALGNALSDAIQGSAERRRQRRSIMRTCMRFKDYLVYGLRKSLWETFNFEEGNARIEEVERQRLLRIQARVASGPQPRATAIAR